MAGSAMKPPETLHCRRWCSCMVIGGAARVWRDQIEYFSDRYHTIAWDMPGYGGSASLPRVSIATLADAFKNFLQQVGAARPILVGHSIGGMIVQQLLTKDPAISIAVVLARARASLVSACSQSARP